jgi:hypothetical protein
MNRLSRARAPSSWVHAYFHRKQGDQGNAVYWYGRAGMPICRDKRTLGRETGEIEIIMENGTQMRTQRCEVCPYRR